MWTAQARRSAAAANPAPDPLASASAHTYPVGDPLPFCVFSLREQRLQLVAFAPRLEFSVEFPEAFVRVDLLLLRAVARSTKQQIIFLVFFMQ